MKSVPSNNVRMILDDPLPRSERFESFWLMAWPMWASGAGVQKVERLKAMAVMGSWKWMVDEWWMILVFSI